MLLGTKNISQNSRLQMVRVRSNVFYNFSGDKHKVWHEYKHKKTKYITKNKNDNTNDRIYGNGVPLEKVTNFTYLGSTVNEKSDHSQEIRQPIKIAHASFNKMRNVHIKINIQLRTHILRCYVLSV